ncbi:hypothetical protein B0H14DRAFT_3517693 [Mycena olivaceomarginata]|nr:hypothetical protein B0H14DRAFT_3517693 [Mycena olivaceomarginata]
MLLRRKNDPMRQYARYSDADGHSDHARAVGTYLLDDLSLILNPSSSSRPRHIRHHAKTIHRLVCPAVRPSLSTHGWLIVVLVFIQRPDAEIMCVMARNFDA